MLFRGILATAFLALGVSAAGHTAPMMEEAAAPIYSAPVEPNATTVEYTDSYDNEFALRGYVSLPNKAGPSPAVVIIVSTMHTYIIEFMRIMRVLDGGGIPPSICFTLRHLREQNKQPHTEFCFASLGFGRQCLE